MYIDRVCFTWHDCGCGGVSKGVFGVVCPFGLWQAIDIYCSFVTWIKKNRKPPTLETGGMSIAWHGMAGFHFDETKKERSPDLALVQRLLTYSIYPVRNCLIQHS